MFSARDPLVKKNARLFYELPNSLAFASNHAKIT